MNLHLTLEESAPTPASTPAPPFLKMPSYASDTEAMGSVDLGSSWIASLYFLVLKLSE